MFFTIFLVVGLGLFDSGCFTVTILGRVSGGMIVLFSLCVRLGPLLLTGFPPPPPPFTVLLLLELTAKSPPAPPPPPPPLPLKQCVASEGPLSLLSACPSDDNEEVDAVAPAEEHKFIILARLAVAGDNMLPTSMPKRQQQQPQLVVLVVYVYLERR